MLRTCETSSGDKNSPPPRPAPRFFSSGIPPPLQKRMSLFCSHGFQTTEGSKLTTFFLRNPALTTLFPPKFCRDFHNGTSFFRVQETKKFRFTTSTTAATRTLYCPPSHPATKKQNEKHSKPSSKQMYLQLHYCIESTQGRYQQSKEKARTQKTTHIPKLRRQRIEPKKEKKKKKKITDNNTTRYKNSRNHT